MPSMQNKQHIFDQVCKKKLHIFDSKFNRLMFAHFFIQVVIFEILVYPHPKNLNVSKLESSPRVHSRDHLRPSAQSSSAWPSFPVIYQADNVSISKKECIPVGSIPPVSVAVSPATHTLHAHPHHTHPNTMHASPPMPNMPPPMHAPCHGCLPPCTHPPLPHTAPPPALHATLPCVPNAMHAPCHISPPPATHTP